MGSSEGTHPSTQSEYETRQDVEAPDYTDAFRSVIEHMPDGFALCRVIFDEDGNPDDFVCEEVNPALEKQAGLRREEVLGRRVTEIFPGIREDPFNWIERLGAVAVTGEILRVEEYVAPLGRWHSICAHRPRAGYFAVLFNDVTERRRAEQELREREERYRTFFQNVAEGLCIFEMVRDERGEVVDGRLVDANPEALRVLGKSPAEVRGKRATELFGAEAIRSYLDVWERIVREGRGITFDTHFRWNQRDYLSSVFPIGADKIVTGTIDISERVRAEQARARSEQEARQRAAELDATFSAMGEGVMLYAPNGRILRLNARAREMLGFEPGIENLPVEERLAHTHLLHPDRTPLTPAELPSSRALKGEPVRGMLLLIDLPAGRRWVSASSSPMRALDGAMTLAVVTLTDVTALHEIQEQRDDLLRMISHDLRTPLSALQLQAQMLRQNIEPDHPDSRRIDAVLINAQRMNAMISDLVELARLETGQPQLNLRPVELRRFVEELKDRVAGALETRRVRVDVEGELPTLQADPERLDRVLVNLLSNALKYSPPDSEVRLLLAARDGRVCIRVEDHGIGIAAEELPHLFERFYRAKSARRTEGLGLGLYISSLLVKAHGGTITVHSEPGKGSTFQVCLPTREQP